MTKQHMESLKIRVRINVLRQQHALSEHEPDNT